LKDEYLMTEEAFDK
jgi:hypothetical protein